MEESKATFGMARDEIDQKIQPLEGRFHKDENNPPQPRLYISFGRGIMMFPLQGRQSLGRMDADSNPDIGLCSCGRDEEEDREVKLE